MAEAPLVRIHYLRPPDRLQVFEQTLVHEDAEVKVTLARGVRLPSPVRILGEVALEAGSDAVWFTFPGQWHDIGRFHRSDGTFTGIYANILTPCRFEEGGIWRTTDLFLDLWIPAGMGDAIAERDGGHPPRGGIEVHPGGDAIAEGAPPRPRVVRESGEELHLLDEEELREAEERGWVDPATAARAREEARRLTEAFWKGEWPPPAVYEWTRERAMGR